MCADLFCRKKRKHPLEINRVRKERCILIVKGKLQVFADISCSNPRGRRQLGMAWLTHPSDKLHGFTKSCKTGRITTET
jgi:hypothetical protein